MLPQNLPDVRLRCRQRWGANAPDTHQ